MEEVGKIKENLVAELLNTGYVLTDYPKQGIHSYAKTISIFEFMKKYGDYGQLSLGHNTEKDIIELFGDSVTIEYVPSKDVSQWTTHNSDKNKKTTDYMEFETFNFNEDAKSAMKLLKLFA